MTGPRDNERCNDNPEKATLLFGIFKNGQTFTTAKDVHGDYLVNCSMGTRSARGTKKGYKICFYWRSNEKSKMGMR